MKRTRTISIAIAIVAAGFLLSVYYCRWGNYANKPLFHNTYGVDAAQSTKFGVWKWIFWPPPIVDGLGDQVFFDFSQNMVAVVQYRPGEDSTGWELEDPHVGSITLQVGNASVLIRGEPNKLVSVDASGTRSVRILLPGEANAIYRELDGIGYYKADDHRTAIRAKIRQLLQPDK